MQPRISRSFPPVLTFGVSAPTCDASEDRRDFYTHITMNAIEVLYEDNHVIVVNKRPGELVQPDTTGDPALEDIVKVYIKAKYNKPGAVFLGVVHRIDRPVGGAVLLAKTSKALVRLNEQLKQREFKKIYWAIVEKAPADGSTEGELRHYIVRNGKTNRSVAYDTLNAIPKTLQAEAKEAILKYKLLASGDRYHLLEIELLTGRHHQIRCQLSKIECPIKGDLKYGAARSNKDGGISLWARGLTFEHPITHKTVTVIAPTPKEDKLWAYFEETIARND